MLAIDAHASWCRHDFQVETDADDAYCQDRPDDMGKRTMHLMLMMRASCGTSGAALRS